MKNFDTFEQIKDYESEHAESEKIIAGLKKLIESHGGAEVFFSSSQYESDDFENYLSKLSNTALELIKEKKFAEVLEIGQKALEASGIESAMNVNPESPDGAVALTEAINWAAKTISYHFYDLKPKLIVAAAQIPGVHFGYGDDSTYSLGSPTIGTASFHDPGDEVGYILSEHLNKDIPQWEYEWSGVSRQESAFEILEDLSSGRGLVEVYANTTSPEPIRIAREKYMRKNFHDRLATLGELFEHKVGPTLAEPTSSDMPEK